MNIRNRLKIFTIVVAILWAFAIPFSAEGQENKDFKMHYMGNVEAGNIFPWKDFLNNSSGVATLTTTHGVVLKPWLYTGIGSGLWIVYSHDGTGVGLPIFADVRFTYPNKSWRPFVDIKAGAYIGAFIWGSGYSHFQFQPSVGLKYAIKDTFGIYLSLGALTHFASTSSNSFPQGLSLNLGFDF